MSPLFQDNQPLRGAGCQKFTLPVSITQRASGKSREHHNMSSKT